MTDQDHALDAAKVRRFGIMAAIAIALISAAGIAWFTIGGGKAFVTGIVTALDRQVSANFMPAVATFLVIAFILQLFVLPTGTIAMLTGGFLFGAPLAAALYYGAQILAAPVVYGAVRLGFGSFADEKLDGFVKRYLPARFSSIVEIARSEGLLAAISLRLAPVITSPVVPILAAATGIKLAALIAGTILVGWVRPLFWASVGATAHSLAEVTSSSEFLSKVNLTPLLLAFAAAAAIFVLRLVLRLRTDK
ncbi:MAG TPA: hypothetical protein PK264_14350 [Hyphomicrobiaceae bacterium]|nr:hypothetical protein [Hyphomicrobiaceae bacterium]